MNEQKYSFEVWLTRGQASLGSARLPTQPPLRYRESLAPALCPPARTGYWVLGLGVSNECARVRMDGHTVYSHFDRDGLWTKLAN